MRPRRSCLVVSTRGAAVPGTTADVTAGGHEGGQPHRSLGDHLSPCLWPGDRPLCRPRQAALLEQTRAVDRSSVAAPPARRARKWGRAGGPTPENGRRLLYRQLRLPAPGGPVGWDGPLVLRLFPASAPAGQARREAIVQKSRPTMFQRPESSSKRQPPSRNDSGSSWSACPGARFSGTGDRRDPAIAAGAAVPPSAAHGARSSRCSASTLAPLSTRWVNTRQASAGGSI